MVLQVANFIFTLCEGGFMGADCILQVVEGGFVGYELHFAHYCNGICPKINEANFVES